MTGHLFVPQMDPKFPVSFSPTIVQGLLKTKMGFKGIVISDALNMQAVTQNKSYGHIALKAFLAGHDLLLYGDHIAPNVDEILHYQIPQAIEALKSACLTGIITADELDSRVLKILKFKQSLNIHDAPEKPEEPLESPSAHGLKRELFREAITLLKNTDSLLPLAPSTKAALIQIGGINPVLTELFSQRGVISVAADEIDGYQHLIVSLSHLNILLPNFGLSDSDLNALQALSTAQVPTTLILFGTPYALRILPEFSALIVAYEEDADALEAARDAVFGDLIPQGKLPVTARFPARLRPLLLTKHSFKTVFFGVRATCRRFHRHRLVDALFFSQFLIESKTLNF